MTSPQESLKKAMMAVGAPAAPPTPPPTANPFMPQASPMPAADSGSMADAVAAQLAAMHATGQPVPGMQGVGPNGKPLGSDPDDPQGLVLGTSGGGKIRVISSPGVEPTQRSGSMNRGGVTVRSGGGVVGTRPQGAPRGAPGQPPPMARGVKIVTAPVQAVVMRPSPAQAQPSSDPYARAPMPQAQAAPRPQAPPPRPSPPMPGVATPQAARQADLTVILTAFERPGLLRVQLAALAQQTVQPKIVLVWENRGRFPQDEQMLSGMTAIRYGMNVGPLERFVFARKVPTEYVAVLDDDLVPGRLWLERSLLWLERTKNDPETHDWMIVAAGEIYRDGQVAKSELIGPESPRGEPMLVDVGRGGFVFRTPLAHRFLEPALGDERVSWRVHIAAKAQREGTLQLVLPYDMSSQDGWGAASPFSKDQSTTISIDQDAQRGLSSPSVAVKQEAVELYRGQGWHTLADEEELQKSAQQGAQESPDGSHLRAVDEGGN